ncbi:NADPH oxidase organizer 1b [Nothobranchius furzeri]|uniref:NADPH oxidase organizer 1-like n=3 Tax=Nothobranchius furzeri TaxID=105023 RepID=A0A9D3BEQ0_NOTFU|nr:NADPH oxidase organizer 1 [Nothobranchius furzeri]KAF7204715.1 NADPH oxidase organizer 1-like [Nothobranchius furzeri]
MSRMTAGRCSVISTRIVGGIRRDKPKLKMFMISVLWADESEVIIYRSFQDFKKFHKQLKKRFPHFNPFRKEDRIIPKFSGKARRSSLQQKGSSKSIWQMKFLESYCKKLLKCDPTVTQSSEVTRFFTPRDHDLQPDYTKNTVMILMSDELLDGERGGGAGRHSVGNVTDPFVTQTYRSVAPYETKDTKNRPFKVAADEKLEVLIKDPAGWWLVENEEKRLAWFPAPYLELDDGEDGDEHESLAGSLYCTVRSYSTKKADEVSVSIGSVVEVLRKSDDGWWLIRSNGKVGYIPSMYLQPYNNPRAGLHGLHRKLHSSSLNLATPRESLTSRPPRISEDNSQHHLTPRSGQQTRALACFHRAQSLNVLSESWQRTERDASTSNSTDSIFSEFSSSSDSTSSLKEEPQSPTGHHIAPYQPDISPDHSLSDRRSSSTSSDSAGSQGNKVTPGPPRVPPRPKAEEILTRCTTMTRKAAQVTKTRLQIQPDSTYSR